MKRNIGNMIAALVFCGFAAGMAWADSESIPFTPKTSEGIGCVGTYTGYAKYTNNAGTLWITPSNGVTSGTFTDASQFGSNYVSIATATRQVDQMCWCGTNTVTFPATNSQRYQLVVYVKNIPPPPTNGAQINLQINWQP
jgi:hypothetical protein